MSRRSRRVVIHPGIVVLIGGDWNARQRPHLSGVMATFTGTCPRCDGPIVARSSRVVRHRGTWIHVGCASGADDA